MLLDGVNHVAVITEDTEALHTFYREVFDAEIGADFEPGPGMRLSFVHIGPHTELNVFELDEPVPQPTEDFHRGRLDHMGLQAVSLEAFDTIRERLIERGATDGFVTDFGPVLSVYFEGPDGLAGEVCVTNPDAEPGVVNPPGTKAAGYEPVRS